MGVFRVASGSIDLSQFQLSSKNKAFVWLCRKRFSTAIYLLSMLALTGKRTRRPQA